MKETENPVTRQITLPLRYQAQFPNGVSKEAKHTFELDQAIVPFRLNDGWALITRTKLPMVVQPPKNHGEKWKTGLGNGYTTFFVSPEHGEEFYWGAGPLLYYPASSSMVGVNRWGSGPSAAFVKKNESPWVFGAVVNNIWTFNSGGDNRNRTNTFLLNPFVSYHIGDRWAVSSSPDVTADWIANGKKMDRAGRGRREQPRSCRGATHQARGRCLLQCDTAEEPQRYDCRPIHRDLSLPRLGGRRSRRVPAPRSGAAGSRQSGPILGRADVTLRICLQCPPRITE